MVTFLSVAAVARVYSGMAHEATRWTVGTPIAADHYDESRFSIGGLGDLRWPLKNFDSADLAAVAW